jgi:hypothetical protein
MARSAPNLSIAPAAPISTGTLMGIAHIAVDLDWRIAERTRQAPIIATQYQVPVAAASQVLDHYVRGETAVGSEPLSAPLVKRAHQTMLEYLDAVQRPDVQYERARGRQGRRG